MLQQTQVATVIPYFERFMERFPNVEALARADIQQVLAAWSGLGYYRRARALHQAARQIVDSGQGFPNAVEGWMDLPGVGRYTAGAVCSISYGHRVPIVDGNVARVLSRVFLVYGNPAKAPAKGELWRLAEQILPHDDLSDFNQALMELGALVCRAAQPRCLVCPWQVECAAHREGVVDRLPELAKRRPSRAESWSAGIVRRQRRVLFFRRRDHVMEDLWELPGGTCRDTELPVDGLVREAKQRYGVDLLVGGELARVKHNIMNRRITVHAFEADLVDGPETAAGMRWLSVENLSELPMSSMTIKLFRALED